MTHSQKSKACRIDLTVPYRAWANRPSRLRKAVDLTFFMLSEDFTFGEFRFVKETGVLFLIKVRLEAFPNGLPMSVLSEIFATLR